jgi:transcriptional regulator with XRE-family HTH domain
VAKAAAREEDEVNSMPPFIGREVFKSRSIQQLAGSVSEPERGHILIEELREARRQAGWSQRTLAGRIGVDPQTIKRLERGIGSVTTLVATMNALDFRLTGLAPGRTLEEQLRARRRQRALSLAALSARTGLSRTTIAQLERGGGSVASLIRLLAVLAPGVRRRARERAFWGQGDKEDRDSRFTPPEFLDCLHAAFGPIDLDPCGHPLSPVMAQRRILPCEGGDGLIDDWSGAFAFVNPPFSALLKWLRRAHDQWRAGNVETVVCLVPVRTDSALFHETLSADADIYLLRGRVRFLDPRGGAQHTPFSLMLLVLGATPEQKSRYAEAVPGFWLARDGKP